MKNKSIKYIKIPNKKFELKSDAGDTVFYFNTSDFFEGDLGDKLKDAIALLDNSLIKIMYSPLGKKVISEIKKDLRKNKTVKDLKFIIKK